MKFSSCTIAGPKGKNQDAILPPFRSGNSTWCAIADGVGSSEASGEAARASIEVVRAVHGNETMADLFARVRLCLTDIFSDRKAEKGFGTTLSVLCLRDSQAIVGHVGDTRISHYRGGGVVSRTKDQTEVQKLLDDGAITKNQAPRYPRRNVLLSIMSPMHDYTLHEERFLIKSKDRILLTSDGFHTKILRQVIAKISTENLLFDSFWQAVQFELQAISVDDDASCIALEID